VSCMRYAMPICDAYVYLCDCVVLLYIMIQYNTIEGHTL